MGDGPEHAFDAGRDDDYASPKDPRGFEPDILDTSVVAVPLLRDFRREADRRAADPALPPEVHPVIFDVNLAYRGGARAALAAVEELIEAVIGAADERADQRVDRAKTDASDHYLFADLTQQVIAAVVQQDAERSQAEASGRLIHKVWPDFPVWAQLTKSVSTIKADAAHVSFSASGQGIVWAVVDSGIDGQHRHFDVHGNLRHPEGALLGHQDFSGGNAPLEDGFGHGTHVAGIIAGESTAKDGDLHAMLRHKDESGEVQYRRVPMERISGVAPHCKLVSLKVLSGKGDGRASNLITALEYVQRINDYGRHIKIHGVNLSVGYDFEPEWFACGQSPLCVEVDRLVMSGVVVVCAAGNTGYGWHNTLSRGGVTAGLDLTINDPGNAEQAITVGATHRDMPHVYGVSYFSSKGPTGDGRLKPDLVAPGEKILSATAGTRRADAVQKSGGAAVDYVEDSGTSMAAPHVSGAIACFLSIRGEFKGRPQRVKEIFLSTATDLRRDPRFQGHGLVDLMRAIQSV